MSSGFLNWLDARFPVRQTFQRYFSQYFVPKNLNFMYCFGILALVALFNQGITGLWLTMFYTPTAAGAFDSIQSIMRDVSWGWLLRYLHATGASAFFIVLYVHIFRGILYGSYQKPRELVWILGVVLWFLSMAQAFFGYLLPFGQLSYWGAQVFTSFIGAVPVVGDLLLGLVRGSHTVGTVLLQRFFAWHVIGIPLLLLLIIFLHVVALHHVGSNNPQGIDLPAKDDVAAYEQDTVPFYPFYVKKDVRAILIFLLVFFAVVFFSPDMAGYFLEPTNLVPANPLLTPDGIHPVWYLTPFYSMLRCIPHQGAGILVTSAGVIILFFLPWLDRSPVRSMRYKGRLSRAALVVFVLSFVCLGVLGLIEPTGMRIILARGFTLLYFAYFLTMPVYTKYESHRSIPNRIQI